VEKLAKQDGMTSYSMTTKHGIILYSSTAGVRDEPDNGDLDDDDFNAIARQLPHCGPGRNGRDIISKVPNAFKTSTTTEPVGAHRLPQLEDADLIGTFIEEEDEDFEDEDDGDINYDELDQQEIYEEGPGEIQEDDPVKEEQDEEDNPVKVDEDNAEQENDPNKEEPEQENDPNNEENLVGPNPVLRRSTRKTVRTAIPNIATTAGKSYRSNLMTFETPKIEKSYDLQEAKILAMIMVQYNETLVASTTHQGHQFLTTYTLKNGIQQFGDKAVAATKKEMQQMLDRTCFVPIQKNELSNAEIWRGLESLLFLIEKKDGMIKSRHCASGSTQRDYINREEVAAPTVSTDSTLLTAVVEVAEGRGVATCDIPNALIQTEVAHHDKDGHRTIMKI
jgi:hypothetical protein